MREREVNARPATPDVPLDERVNIQGFRRRGIYTVNLPRRGRLGDLSVLDHNGDPILLGFLRPNHPATDSALREWERISDAFDRLNGVSA